MKSLTKHERHGLVFCMSEIFWDELYHTFSDGKKVHQRTALKRIDYFLKEGYIQAVGPDDTPESDQMYVLSFKGLWYVINNLPRLAKYEIEFLQEDRDYYRNEHNSPSLNKSTMFQAQRKYYYNRRAHVETLRRAKRKILGYE